MMTLQRNLQGLIKNILIGVSFLLLIGCEDESMWIDSSEVHNYHYEWDARLPIDENGYYHLVLDRNEHQTLHRISGIVKDGIGEPVNVHRVGWESSHYWVLGDTLGYIVHSGYTDDWVYVSYDTTYVTGFEGMEVRTSNWASYSDIYGEFHNMIAPVITMLGDTMSVGAYSDNGLEKEFKIILD